MRYASIRRIRLAILLVTFVVLCLVDVIQAPLTDRLARAGSGYPHQLTFAPDATFVGELRSWKRVAFNFLHFGTWWFRYPGQEDGWSLGAVLKSDGNTVATNVVGHLIVGYVLALVGLGILPAPRLIFALGTGFNIFQEYVAEGVYVDPSFIDLWLGEIALVLALITHALWRKRADARHHRHHHHTDEASQASHPE